MTFISEDLAATLKGGCSSAGELGNYVVSVC